MSPPPDVKVTFLPAGRTVRSAPGRTVLEIALEHEIDLPHNCGGVAGCLSCHVIPRAGKAGLAPPSEKELDKIEEIPGATLDSRLACQARVFGDCTLEIPPHPPG